MLSDGGEAYKFHLLLNAELEAEYDYIDIGKSKYKEYNYSMLRHIELEDNCLIRAYNEGEDVVYMHSMFRARKTGERGSNKVSAASKIIYRKFNDLYRPRDILF
jgi:hypothetical protein